MKGMRFLIAVPLFFLGLLGAAAAPVEVRIQNSTGFDVNRLYIAPISWTDWGEDYLGGKIIRDGETFVVVLREEVRDDCMFDIRAVDGDGDEYARYEIDLCRDPVVALSINDYIEPEEVAGEEDSYDEGYNTGYEEGFKAGRQEGFKEGYGQGFKDGFKEGSGKIR